MSQSKSTCSICLNECVKPRTLKCSHTFCEDCVADYAKQFKRKECFPCPMCRKNISVKSKAAATSASTSSVLKKYCNAHDEVVNNYCLDCKRLVCRRCCLTTHKPHKMATIGKKYPECMKEFQSVKRELEEQLPKFNQHSQQVRVKIREIQKSGEDACKDVDDSIQELTRALVKVGEDMKSDIWKNCLGEEKKMNDLLSQSANDTQTILANLKYADEVVKDKSLSEIEHFKSVMLNNKLSNGKKSFSVADFNRSNLVKGSYNTNTLKPLVGSIRVIKPKSERNCYYDSDSYDSY